MNQLKGHLCRAPELVVVSLCPFQLEGAAPPVAAPLVDGWSPATPSPARESSI